MVLRLPGLLTVLAHHTPGAVKSYGAAALAGCARETFILTVSALCTIFTVFLYRPATDPPGRSQENEDGSFAGNQQAWKILHMTAHDSGYRVAGDFGVTDDNEWHHSCVNVYEGARRR